MIFSYLLTLSSLVTSYYESTRTEFGMKTRILAPIIGFYIYYASKNEERKIDSGWSYEPTTSYEKNDLALSLETKTMITIQHDLRLSPQVNIHKEVSLS